MGDRRKDNNISIGICPTGRPLPTDPYSQRTSCFSSNSKLFETINNLIDLKAVLKMDQKLTQEERNVRIDEILNEVIVFHMF
jgi:hypothetical protein